MVLSEKQLSILSYLVDKKKYSCARAAREIGVNEKTARKYCSQRFKGNQYKERSQSVKLARRNSTIRRLATLTSKKGDKVFPTHGSSSAIRRALFAQTKELLSTRQVRRCLRSGGLRPYVRRRVPTRSAKEMNAKKAFAKRQLKNKKWRSIVFSDETWLSCNEVTGRVQWAARRSQVLPVERKARWNVPSIMIWAAIGVGYKSDMIIFPPRKTDADGELRTFRLDSKSYVRRCLQYVVPAIVARGKILQQDGARSHASKHVREYLKRKGVNYIEDWPPYSPDLNMIEPLWKTLAAEVGKQCPQSQDELVAAAKKAWRELPQHVVDRHVLHFRKACSELV